VFPRLDLLHWIDGRAAAADHDLGTTNQQLGHSLERLADREPPSSAESLQEQLAGELGVAEEELLVTAGTTHANFLGIATALEADGNEVLVESPGYEPLVETPRGFGATVRRVERPAANAFELVPDRVEAALTTDTALIAVTNRHNPSGRRTAKDRLRTIAAIAVDQEARLLVDEVYGPFAEGSVTQRAFGASTMAGVEGTVVTGALTKFFGLGALRIGWLVADPAFVDRAREVAAHLPVVSGVTTQLAERMLADRDSEVAAARERAEVNAELLGAFLEERADLEGAVDGGCPIVFPTHARADGDRVAAAAWDAGVLVVPGRFFDDFRRFRLGAAHPPATTRDALDAFGRSLDQL